MLIAGDADQAGTRGVGAAIEALIDVGIRAAMWLPDDTTGCMLDHDLDCVRGELLERRFGNDLQRVVMLIGRTSDSRASERTMRARRAIRTARNLAWNTNLPGEGDKSHWMRVSSVREMPEKCIANGGK